MAGGDAAASTEAPPRTAAAPKAASLQALLEQALQTNDDGQLEMCLCVTDGRVIDATVARLAAPKVIPLLTALIARFEAKPARGAALLPWLRSVLVQHTGHLMAVPGLVQRLARLYQTVDARLATFKKLLKLDGRLDVVLSQLSLQRYAGVCARMSHAHPHVTSMRPRARSRAMQLVRGGERGRRGWRGCCRGRRRPRR